MRMRGGCRDGEIFKELFSKTPIQFPFAYGLKAALQTPAYVRKSPNDSEPFSNRVWLDANGPEPVPTELTARLPREWPVADPVWRPQEIPLDDGRVPVLDGDPVPPEAPAD